MADQKFPAGAQVQLNSGGPIMTVVAYDVFGMGATEKSYHCRWFDKTTLKEGYFTEPELHRID